MAFAGGGGLHTLQERCFADNCLLRVVIPASVRQIGSACFGNNDLVEVCFSGAGAKVSPQAFMKNSKLQRVIVEGDAPPVSRL